MVVFKLTMPNRNTWNGKWTGDEMIFARRRKDREVPKEVIGKSFFYYLDDGWTACVSVDKMDCKEANKIIKKSSGFCGYDWMIESIIRYGEIRYERKEIKNE